MDLQKNIINSSDARYLQQPLKIFFDA